MTVPPLYPDVRVKLAGEDGHPLVILGRCRSAARDAGLAKEEIESFLREATTGDYDHLLLTVVKWFSLTVESDDDGVCPHCNEDHWDWGEDYCSVIEWEDM